MDTVTFGCERLDELLGGGLPANRTLLVSGPPGAGKTTLGMQFLQAGVDAGEDCLLVSTEQTVAELRDTFEPYRFDVDAPELTVVTINAEPGSTIEDDSDLVVRTLEEGDASVAEWFDLPFTHGNVVQYLSEFGPVDRVVLDSVSGIRPMAERRVDFWRSTYNLIRLFSDRFDATAVLTAQGDTGDAAVASDLIRYATHGILDVEWDTVGGQRHRFVRVSKMRGQSFDDRRHKLVSTDEGFAVRPHTRSQPAALHDHDHLSTGVPALDDLLGGGLVRGAFTLLTHDGTTGYYALNARLLASAVDAGMTLAVALPAQVSLDQLDRYWQDADWDVDALLAEDRLVVLELAGTSDRDHRNVVTHDRDAGRDWQRLAELSYERSGGDGLFALVDTEPLLQTVSAEEARDVRYRGATTLTGSEDVVVYTINPRLQADELVAFYVDTSTQTVDCYRDDDGLEWVEVEKSPTGSPGSSRLVTYESDPPYVDFV